MRGWRQGRVGAVPMWRIAAAVVLLVLAAVPALAADMEVPPLAAPAPPNSYYPARAPLSWGGGYFGVNGGYALGINNWTNAGVSTGNYTFNGALLGGTAGLNFAGYGGFVFGVEGDMDWSSQKGSSSAAACFAIGAPAGTSCTGKAEWLSTARARVGYAFDRVLVFGTAGAAIGDLEAGLNPPGEYDNLAPRAGWTAGGGIEYAFADFLTAKVEYLYIDFAHVACPQAGTCGSASNVSILFTESVIRAGVNYKFTW